MELNELTRKITAMQSAAKERVTVGTSEAMRLYLQGYGDGLDAVLATIRKAIEAERMRQRLARLESELAHESEPDWPELPSGLIGDSKHAPGDDVKKASTESMADR